MTHRIELRTDAPIIVATESADGDMIADMAADMPKIMGMLEQQPGPTFLILDLRAVKPPKMEDHVQAASMSARGDNAMLHHPNLRETVFVITDPVMKAGVRGLSSDTFGAVRLAIFDTLDAAIGYCYEKLGRAAGEVNGQAGRQAKAG